MKIQKKPIESKDIKVNVNRLKHLGIQVDIEKVNLLDKEILCHAIGNRGLAHAWGVGKNEKEAEEQCRLAVKESLEENKTKWRHAPFKYVIQK